MPTLYKTSDETFDITQRMFNVTSQYGSQSITIQEYITDIKDLTKKQIIKREEIVKNFLFYTEETIKSIFQIKFFVPLSGQIYMNNITLFLEEGFCALLNITVPAGFWHTNNLIIGPPKIIHYGFDIISLHTYLLSRYQRTYSQSVEEIYDFFATRNFIKRNGAKEFYIQEHNPIACNMPIFFDSFFAKFEIVYFSKIVNEHSRQIGIAVTIRTAENEYVDLYYTLWRHTNSPIFGVFPLLPQRSHSLLFIKDTQYGSSTDFILTESFHDAMKTSNDKRQIRAFICGGFENLQYTNCQFVANTTFTYFVKRQLTYLDLNHLRNFQKDKKISVFLVAPRLGKISVEIAMKDPQLLDIEKTTVETLLATPDKSIVGSQRKRFTILDPIIESGTITWLFAQEKAGKTILALFLAQIIGIGNRKAGPLCTYDPRKVLYIDGEMPGDKLQGHIDKIIRGMGASADSIGRAFSIFLFAETDFLYEDILDETWQEKYLEELMQYDLIILDNYYTLYSSLNPIKLIRWMKKLTRKGVTFLVLDHTNSEGELQGSHVKRRAMDLGLKLELCEENKVDMTCHADRYGVAQHVTHLSFIKYFTSSEFHLDFSLAQKATAMKPHSEVHTPIQESLSPEDTELMVIYLLHLQGKLSKEVAEILEKKPSLISKRLKSMAFDAKLGKKANSEPAAQEKQKYIVSMYEKNRDEFDAALNDMIEIVQINS